MDRKTSKTIKEKNEKGFALLIAVMMVAILISVTFVMFDMGLKQLTLATTGRESQTALYAADSGLECAMFWDRRGSENVFYATDCSNGTCVIVQPSASTIGCNDNSIPIAPTSKGSAVVTDFYSPGPVSSTCFDVEVTKYWYLDPNNTNSRFATYITSRGYNTPYDSSTKTCLGLANPQRVERGLDVYY